MNEAQTRFNKIDPKLSVAALMGLLLSLVTHALFKDS